MEEKNPTFVSSATMELARKLGIELEYTNAAGQQIVVAPEVIREVIGAMGYRTSNDADARAILQQIQEDERSRKLPPVLVKREKQRVRIPVKAEAAPQTRSWRLIGEDGKIAEEGMLAGRAPGTDADGGPAPETDLITLTVELPCGYHRFEIDDESMPLIVVPAQCWLAPVEQGQKLWGIAAQLYLLRSERNWGIGDFADLNTLIEIAADWGASAIGLNPLHALFLDDPELASPYAPASRLYLNILNIDVTAIPEFAGGGKARALLEAESFASDLSAARARVMVNYRAVADLKLRVLHLAYSDFKQSARIERQRSLEAFIKDRGISLLHFCVWQAIRLDQHQKNRTSDQGELPEDLQTPNSPAIDEFVKSHREEIEFLVWTQWIADTQLCDAARLAKTRGMAITLYRDLAVGSGSASAEGWSNPEVMARKAHAGVPPDIVNPAGQNWGLPPFNPRTLRESGYAPFIELVRANMRYCGALRIDHAAGLQHLYWVPAGRAASEGAYVIYPFEDLAGILALESCRNQCLVIGEDLGTIPAGFSENLNQHGILSYRVLYFEQDESGEFIAPEGYPTLALATVGSHDLATLKGWWRGDDIAIREQHGLYPEPREGQRQLMIRREAKRRLQSALQREYFDPGHGDDFFRLSLAVHSFLARCGSAIAMLQLENLTGEESQTNLPATSTEYPNWRRRLSKSLETLRTDPDIAAVIDAVRRERSRS